MMTDKPQWTPGPWHVDSVHSEALHEICMTNPPPGEGNPVVLASVSYDEDRGTCPTLRQANANARLIAAAPGMYEALAALAAKFRHCGSPEVKAAFDALAKARGE